MKRIAILLAAVGLGSGCVVSTCDPSDLAIDWRFVDVNGVGGLGCNSLALSADIDTVDVFVDGLAVDSGPTYFCSVGGVTYPDFASGTHEIIVEGYDIGGFLITRDIRSVNVDSCGGASVLVTPGEAILEVTPDFCDAGGYLWYSLADTTFSPPVPVASVGAGLSVPCASGITVGPVPYGYYQFDWIEEVNGSSALLDWGTCSDPEHAVFSWNAAAFGVHMYDTFAAACP